MDSSTSINTKSLLVNMDPSKFNYDYLHYKVDEHSGALLTMLLEKDQPMLPIALPGQVVCQVCKAPVSHDQMFCSHCGQRLKGKPITIRWNDTNKTYKFLADEMNNWNADHNIEDNKSNGIVEAFENYQQQKENEKYGLEENKSEDHT